MKAPYKSMMSQCWGDFYVKNGKVTQNTTIEELLEANEIAYDELSEKTEALELAEEENKRLEKLVNDIQDDKDKEIMDMQEQRDELRDQLEAIERPEPARVDRPITGKQANYLYSLTGRNYIQYVNKWGLNTTRASHLISAAISMRKAA